MAAVLLVPWFMAGWESVPADRYVVRVSRWLALDPVPMDAGWHWTPPLLASTRSYPRGVEVHRFVIGTGESRLISESGAALALSGRVRYRVDESGLAVLSWRVPPERTGAWLDASLRDAVRQLLAAGQVPAADANGEALLVAEVSRRLAAAGLSLVDLDIESVGGPHEIVATAGARSIPGARVLLIGWDGADWNILEPLLAAGSMPHLQGLLARGARARLKTITPVLSPVVWTSVATGTGPDKHGIVDFLAVDRTTGERVPVTSNLRQTPALWTLLDRHGLNVGVVAWWATWPAEAVHGYMVTDRIAYQLFGMGERLGDDAEGKTWPRELYEEIAPLVRRPESIPDEQVRAFAELPEDLGALSQEDGALFREFKTVLAATETYDAIALQLARRNDPVLRCVYYQAGDTAAHLFMKYRPPRMDSVSEVSFHIWNGTVDAVYRDLDRRLGRLLETVDDRTSVILLSDHGFRTGDNRPVGESRIGSGQAAEWHRKYGVLVMSGPFARASAEIGDASVLDIAPTVLALLGLPVPGGMDGRVLEEALTREFLRAHPVRRQEPAGQARAASEPIRSHADAAIVQRLRALGYIGADPVSRLEQDQVTAYNNRGTILLTEGRVEEAVAELRHGLDLAPDAVPLRINLARALRAAGRDDEALALLLAVLLDRPASPEVSNLAGNVYLDRGDLVRAEAYFRRSLAIDPNFTGGHISMGLLHERQGDPEAALRHYRRAAEIDPDAAEPLNNIGNVQRGRALDARARGNEPAAATLFAEAAAAYQEGLRADPDFIGSYNNLALVYQDTGRPEEAMVLYRQALDRDPENAVVHNNLGSLYFAAARLEDARREFEQAIQSMPEYESAYNNLGAVLGRLGQFDDEIDAYRKAVELEPGYADGHHNLGLALLRRGEYQEAEKALGRAIQIDPAYVSAYIRLGDLYLQNGQAAGAIEMFTACLRINPALVIVRNQLAEAHLAAGEVAKGIEEYRRSLRDQPDQPDIQARLAELGG